MKIIAILIMLAALFLLYRIAYPKQTDTKKGGNPAPPEKPKAVNDVMGKSRFVLPDRNKPLQAPATAQKTETTSEKAITFAAETVGQPSKAIPANELNKVFSNEPNLEILSIPLENETDDESEIDFEVEEEAEELNRTLGHEAVIAEGLDYDKLQTAVKVVMEQPEDVSAETAQTLLNLKDTDMFEMLVSGNESKMNWIKSVVERHIQNTMPETDTENEITDYGDFEVADFIS
ncbi:MAG: DUF4122 domain-containing protein [Tannerella sp.]|jgi:hypothetical protein|nr:DUF4122 domain-containing protein [Tannerella sp.]